MRPKALAFKNLSHLVREMFQHTKTGRINSVSELFFDCCSEKARETTRLIAIIVGAWLWKNLDSSLEVKKYSTEH